MIAPPASWWRHSVTIRRKSRGKDAALAMVASDADSGQVVLCNVQERSQDTRPTRVDGPDAITAHRFFDVLIPATDPTTGTPQFPTGSYPDGPAIRTDDTILWGSRTLRVTVDVDGRGRGGFDLIYTAYCMEIL